MPALAIITALLPLVESLVGLIGKLRADVQQSAELTPAQEADLDARIAAAMAQPWWKPTPPAG
jgi:hypothetical protein